MILWPMLELGILFPGALACFLAAAERLRVKKRTAALIVVFTLLAVCVLCGALCWRMDWPTNRLLLPILVPAAIGFARMTTLPAWKSVSVFLGVCGAFSGLVGPASIIDALVLPGNASPWLSPAGSLAHSALGWVLAALIWYPTIRHTRALLETDTVVSSWYVFWVLPVVFVLMNLLLSYHLDAILRSGQLLGMYALLSLVMTGLLLLFYGLFYLVARELERNLRLEQENQFLQMQTAQYENLRTAIEETRIARHDLRHHFSTLSALADRGAWEDLRCYLAEAAADVPADELRLCENQAVDGVAGRYSALSRRNGVHFTCELDLPPALPVSEMDVCVVLQNLLENALEASRRTEGEPRYIRLRAVMHGDNLVLITVENGCQGGLTERDGVLLSSKRPGEGLGLRSVAHIAEKNGGYCRFVCESGAFIANVMLRGGAELLDP